MMENAPLVGSGASASLLLGRKLDSIPFSLYHVQIILVLGVVGFVEGYDLVLIASLRQRYQQGEERGGDDTDLQHGLPAQAV